MAFARAPATSSPPIQLFNKKGRQEINIGAPFENLNKIPLLYNRRVVVTSFIAVQGQAKPQCIARQTLANCPAPCIAARRQPLSRETLQKGTRRGFGNPLAWEKPSAGRTVSSLGALSLSEASVELADASQLLSAESADFVDESRATMQSTEKSNVGWSQESGPQSAAKSSLQEAVGQKAEDKKAESWVPRRLSEAAVHFLKQPSVLLSLVAIAAVAAARSRFPWRLADGPVILIMAAWWAFFEWFLHAKLLHSNYNWFGRGIHKRHHEAPFHHVSIDGLDLVAVSLVAFAAFCFALFGKSPLALTGTLTVYTMGLVYEWTHYLVHTKVPMRSYIGSLIKRAHVSHHLKDQRYWLSFTCPPIDVLMGTTPEGGQGVTPVT